MGREPGRVAVEVIKFSLLIVYSAMNRKSESRASYSQQGVKVGGVTTADHVMNTVKQLFAQLYLALGCAGAIFRNTDTDWPR